MTAPERPGAVPVAGRPPSGKPASEERAIGAKTTPPAAAPKAAKGLVVKVLALTDKAVPAFRALAEAYLQQGLGLSAQDAKTSTVQIEAWADLPRILRGYASIDALVLVAHGSPGALRIGTRIRGLDLVAKDLTPPMPAVSEIDFEACNVGSSPGELVAFAGALGATKVSAFNHYLMSSPITVTIAPDVDIKVLAERLKPYEPWLLPNHPTVEQLAKSKGQISLTAEWFRDTEDETPLPAALTPSKAAELRRTFKPRSSARESHLTAAQALSRSAGVEPPVVPLERIIIDLK